MRLARPVVAAGVIISFYLKGIAGSGMWLGTNHITGAALTDALIFMAAGMLLARTFTLLARSRQLAPAVAPAGADRRAEAVIIPTDR